MPRTPLRPINDNIRRRGPDLSVHKRASILAGYNLGATRLQLSYIENTPLSTIDYTVDQNSTRVLSASKPKSGRPKRLNNRKRRLLARIARREPTIIYKALREQVGAPASRSTYYRELKRLGLTNWLAKKRPMLGPNIAEKRLAWALAHQDWTQDQWARVIWSDECSVERGTGKRRTWVLRTPAQKWDREMIQPYKKGHDISIMVWAAFWGTERSDLVIMERDELAPRKGFTQNSYLEVLEDQLPTIYQDGLIFMQDNAPIHTATRIKSWLAENLIEVMDWPPYSPDLNPIEHMWFLLKEKVYEVAPEIEQLKGGLDSVRYAFSEALERAWQLIDDDILAKLVGSMEKRVQAVIKAKGWHTRY